MCAQQEITSPCVSICKLDQGTQVCIGCYRTIEEIAGWRQYSQDQKIAVLNKLPERKRQYDFAER